MIWIFLLVIVLFRLIIYAIFAATYYFDNKGEQKLSYRQFLRISCVAREKWKIVDCYDCYLHYITDSENVNVYMKTYFDMLRLRRLYKRLQKEKDNVEYLNERAKLIKSWQKDINNYHDDYLEEIGVYLKKGKKL